MEKLNNILSNVKTSSEIDDIIIEASKLPNKATELFEKVSKIATQVENEKEIQNIELTERNLQQEIRINNDNLAQMKYKVQKLQTKHEILNSILATKKEQYNDCCMSFKEQADRVNELADKIMENFDIKLKVKQNSWNLWEYKVIFDMDKHVIFQYRLLERSFELISMEPKHPKFEKIQEFLRVSLDISGFLYNVRKYFVNSKSA